MMRGSIAILVFAGTLAACAEDSTGPKLNCTGTTAMTIGATATGVSSDNVCEGPDGEKGQIYAFTLPTAGNVNFAVTGSLNGELTLYSGLSSSPATAVEIMNVAVNGTGAGRAFLPAGSFFLVVEPTSNTSGSYTINPTSIADNPNCFVKSFISRGVTVSGSVTGVDCTNPDPIVRVKTFYIYLKSGQTINFTLAANKVGGFYVGGPSSTTPLFERTLPTQTGGTVTGSVTATTTGYYNLNWSSPPQAAGVSTYSLSVQ
jgi:hypothetical protein